MNDRQQYALLHPLSDGRAGIEPYRTVDLQPDGNLLVLVLAVDR